MNAGGQRAVNVRVWLPVMTAVGSSNVSSWVCVNHKGWKICKLASLRIEKWIHVYTNDLTVF